VRRPCAESVAAELFSAHGVEAASMRRIAARAGIGQTPAHKYFGTKTGVLHVTPASRDER
jgi:AcrR family transcriptional regulator